MSSTPTGTERGSDTSFYSHVTPSAVDIGLARHATEPSRYLLAVLASSVALAIFSLGWIVIVGRFEALRQVGVAVLSLGFLWLAIQIHRIRLLGAAVKVSRRTTPELQRAVDFVRLRLDYTKRTDVYVTDRITEPIVLQSLLGSRILLVKGDFVADLVADEKEAELTFLLATYFGALKAKYDRFNLVLLALEAVGVLRVVNPLINPWYRATVYSGDQMAYLCCNDLQVSLSVAFRSLVGKGMAPFVQTNGVLDQARSVRRSLILRLSQLMSPAPHPTNRYLNLLSFAATRTNEQYGAFLGALDADVAQYLETHRARHRVTGGPAPLMPFADVLAGLVLAFGVMVGLVLANDNGILAPDDVGNDVTPVGGTPVQPVPEQPTPEEPAPPSEDATDQDFDAFIASLPYGFARTCVDETAELGDLYSGITVVAICFPTAAGTPDAVWLYKFGSSSDAVNAFEERTIDTPEGECPDDAPAVGGWSQDGGAGSVGCYIDDDGLATVLWTDESAGLLTVATGEDEDTLRDVVHWWAQLPVVVAP